MPHLHQNSASETTTQPETARNARYGLVLFSVYALLYGVFMLLSAFWPQVMETIVFAGINLAVLYGLGLIGTAFALALIYAWLCRARPGSEGRL